jgi:hypothetical protein
MLAPLSRKADFSSGGDARPTLHTFHPEWADHQDHLERGAEIEYAYVYEGKGKLTWPLQKMRVAGKPVDSDTEEDHEDAENEEQNEEEEEEWQPLDPEAEAQILEDLHLRERADSHRASPTPQPVVPANGNGAGAAKKMRVRVRRTEDADGRERLKVRVRTEGERLKVRVRTEGERGNESMRRLPRRTRAALDVQGVAE